MELSDLMEAVKKNEVSPDIFLSELWKLSKGVQRKAPKFGPGQVTLYRTRVHRGEILPKKITDLSYPPLEKTRLRRANDASEQVFYASAGFPTTLAESRVRAGEFIIASKWQNTGDLVFQKVGLEERMSEIEAIYHEVFTYRGESMYAYSAKVAAHLMGADFISGLMYPSIINENKSHNVAIKKDHVDKSLAFVNATLYKVEDIFNDTKYKVVELDFALPSDNEFLDWKGRKKQWVLSSPGSELKMISNGWDFDVYASDGTFVNPQ